MQGQRQKLIQFVSQRIDHSQNPESFRYQLQLEINHHLKQQQQQLKQQRIKLRNHQLQEEEVRRRMQLQQKLTEKCQKGSLNKVRLLEERVKSMSELRHRREEYTAAKLKQSRKQQLKQSLLKIQKFQQERQQLLNSKLSISKSETKLSKSMQLSHLQRRNQNDDAKYEAMVLKLQSKGIFTEPTRKAISQLNAERAKLVRTQASRLEEEAQNIIGAKLEKIEGARARKEAMLRQKTMRVKQQEEYQHQLKKSKMAQIEAKQRAKRKQLQTKSASKLRHLQSAKYRKEESDKSKYKAELQQRSFEQSLQKKKEKQPLRDLIRREIQKYKQKND